MALKFQLRSTSLDAWYATAKKAHAASKGTPSVVDSAIAGVFGGKLIDLNASSPASLKYMGGENWAVGVNGLFTLLVRMVPKWTGNPGSSQDFFHVGDASGLAFGGIALVLGSGGTVNIQGHNDDGSTWYGDQLYGSPTAFPPFVEDEVIDVWLRWNGEANGNIELWCAANGETAVQIASGNGNAYIAGTLKNYITSLAMGMGQKITGDSNFLVNEVCIWDTFENPASFGARAGFVSAPNFEGYLSTSPAENKVLAGEQWIDHGVGKTGTLPPAVECPVFTTLDEEDVRDGLAFTADDEEKVGSLKVPARADVRATVPVDDTTGLLTLPVPADVREETLYDNGTKEGTLDLPATGDTRLGVVFDNGTKTGTLDSLTLQVGEGTADGEENEGSASFNGETT